MFLPDDIINVILLFLSEFELVDWILVEKLNWYQVSSDKFLFFFVLEITKDVF